MVSDPRDGIRAKTQVSGPEGPLTISALGMTRTFNLLIRSQMLYPLSYECLRLAIVEARPRVRLLVSQPPHGPQPLLRW